MVDNLDELRWLHISDFHFKSGESYDRDVVLRAFIVSLPTLLKRTGKPDLIFVSGDVAFSGKRDEYREATKFFDHILSETKLTRRELIVVPGNHDVDRAEGKGLKRTLTCREDSDQYFDPSKPLPHIASRQRSFADWYNEYFSGIRVFSEHSTCNKVEILSVRKIHVAVLGLNSAAFAFDEGDHGKLWLGRRCVEEAAMCLQRADADLKLAILHHPLEWLASIEGANVRGSIRTSADCILSGHLHETDVEHVAGLRGNAVHLSAGAAYQTRQFPNRALLCSLKKSTLSVLPIRYEDAPREVWTVDPSIFPDGENFEREFVLQRSAHSSIEQSLDDVPEIRVADYNAGELESVSSKVQAAKAEFEQDLFATPSGALLYAEPRLMDCPQETTYAEEKETRQVFLDEILDSNSSYMIETRAEYGGSTLCKRIAYEFSVRGNNSVYRKDARVLPNYRKKLEAVFPAEAQIGGPHSVLILDHFDLERDERLLKELSQTNWFARIIAVSVNRGFRPGKLIDPNNLSYNFEYLYLWNIGRSDVRHMAATLFQSGDDAFISTVVDKVYRDLLGLCIPLTPSNVIMYLRILYREGEFHPLNRVDIVGRYLQEILRKPSDVYRDTFNSKNKLDVISAFVHGLYRDSKSEFDDRYWHTFVATYQEQTLTDFDSVSFLHELLEARIFVRYGRGIFLKYSFFFTFFLGRYICLRSDLLAKFLEDEEYLRLNGVVDVITGLSSENTLIVSELTNRLETHLNLFASKYVQGDFDPLASATWPDSATDDERIWKPIAAQIEAGPRSVGEIDEIKSSLVSEARTTDQEVNFAKFVELENALFTTATILTDALRNSDDIDGREKLRALDVILKAHKVAFQVGTAFSPVIAERRYFRWGGVAFANFDRAARLAKERGSDPKVAIVTSLNATIGHKAAEDIGTRKLAAVFRARERGASDAGFLEFLNFNCILMSKGAEWEQSLTDIIKRTDKNSFYLYAMLGRLMANIRNDIVQGKERDQLKKLIALVRAKREFGKKSPGAKAVDKMLEFLERNNTFAAKKEK